MEIQTTYKSVQIQLKKNLLLQVFTLNLLTNPLLQKRKPKHKHVAYQPSNKYIYGIFIIPKNRSFLMLKRFYGGGIQAKNQLENICEAREFSGIKASSIKLRTISTVTGRKGYVQSSNHLIHKSLRRVCKEQACQEKVLFLNNHV